MCRNAAYLDVERRNREKGTHDTFLARQTEKSGGAWIATKSAGKCAANLRPWNFDNWKRRRHTEFAKRKRGYFSLCVMADETSLDVASHTNEYSYFRIFRIFRIGVCVLSKTRVRFRMLKIGLNLVFVFFLNFILY